MKQHRRLPRAALFAVGLCIVLGGAGAPISAESAELPTAAPESVGFSSSRLALLDTNIAGRIATGRLPGASVLLMRHGKIVLTRVYGKADADTGAPLRVDSIFRIYSQTKPLTGVALMILFEQGKWHFDDPITRFIPEFESLRVFKQVNPDGTVQTEPLSRPPTMRELLTHSAGFAYGLNRSSPVESAWLDADFMRSANADEAIRKIATLPLFEGER